MNINPLILSDAIDLFGEDEVEDVRFVVEATGDADLAYSVYQDEDNEDACAIIEMLYWSEDE
jgi:hypothetical protein